MNYQAHLNISFLFLMIGIGCFGLAGINMNWKHFNSFYFGWFFLGLSYLL